MGRGARNWTIGLGLLGAILTLLAGILSLEERRRALAAEVAQLKRVEQEKIASEIKLRDELAAERAKLAAQERAAVCMGHQANIREVDGRFSELMSRHGTLLTLLKECVRGDGDDDKKAGCSLTVCAGAGIFYGVDCTAVGQNAAALIDDIKRLRGVAVEDQCQIGATAIERFVED